jgi:hypothetical protein
MKEIYQGQNNLDQSYLIDWPNHPSNWL